MALQSYTQRELQMKSASDSLPSITEIFLRSIPINCCLLFLTNVFREAVKKKKKKSAIKVKVFLLAPVTNVLAHSINRVGGFPPKIRPPNTRSW